MWSAWISLSALGVLCALLSGGCEKIPATPPVPTTAPAKNPPVRVASLVPSATDLMLGAGMGEHLVAVSNYCRANPDAARIPSAGDYQTTDWERLASVKPNLLLVFMAEGRIPPGMRTRAAELGIRIEVVGVETVGDVLAGITKLGKLVGEEEKAQVAREKLEARLAAIRQRAAGKPPVRTLIVLGDSAKGVIGPGGFLDELLTVAGGENAAAGLGSKYPTVDEEKLATLGARRIIHLLPGATDAQVAEARAMWERRGTVAPDRITVLTGWWLLQPGYRIGDTAEAFERALSTGGGK